MPASAVKSWKPVQKEATAAWVNFASAVQTKTNSIVVFYAITNGTQTVFFTVYTSNEGPCADELEHIINSIAIAEAGQKDSDKTKSNKTRGKKVRVLPLKSLKAFVN